VNRYVNAIAGRLSLRPPQRRSLEILDRITEIVPPRKAVELTAALAAVVSRGMYVTVTPRPRSRPASTLLHFRKLLLI
jgi:type III restriction enzyme